MKYPSLIILLCLGLAACKNSPPSTPQEKMLCGRWMTSDKRQNWERFHFKTDGTFTDMLDNGINLRTAETWNAADAELKLRYKHAMLLSLSLASHYHIVTLNDSVLVIATKATRRRKSRQEAFRKMKLNGKFIIE
jgi:hypothetical protein